MSSNWLLHKENFDPNSKKEEKKEPQTQKMNIQDTQFYQNAGNEWSDNATQYYDYGAQNYPQQQPPPTENWYPHPQPGTVPPEQGYPYPQNYENVPPPWQNQNFSYGVPPHLQQVGRWALVCSAFSPIYMLPGRYTIGREQNNSIVLSDHTVSKVHLIVTVDSEYRVFIEDTGSKNGTLVNGLKIQVPVYIKLGDKISVGKFQIFYKDLNTAQLKKIPTQLLNNETASMEFDGKNSIIGSLTSMSLTELFSTLETNSKTGILTVSDGANEGKVYFRKGKVIRCEFRGVLNMNCIYTILKLKNGGFEFSVSDLGHIPDQIPLSTQQILLEFARTIDENKI